MIRDHGDTGQSQFLPGQTAFLWLSTIVLVISTRYVRANVTLPIFPENPEGRWIYTVLSPEGYHESVSESLLFSEPFRGKHYITPKP